MPAIKGRYTLWIPTSEKILRALTINGAPKEGVKSMVPLVVERGRVEA